MTIWAAQPPPGPAQEWAEYATEVLAHAGISHAGSDAGDAPSGVVLVTSPVTPADAETLAAWVEQGGALVVTAEPGPLSALAGVTTGAASSTAQVTVHGDGTDVWTHVPPRPLRAVGGLALTPAEGTTTLASWPDGSAAITARRHGDGVVVTFGADVLQSIVRIQQGFAVVADGVPASDGTAPIDDDILKAEDGMALDLETDRALPPGEGPVPDDYTHTYPPPSAVPMFDQPHADWWRSLLLQSVWWAAEETGVLVPWLGYWPEGISAIAHMSHDSDGNKPEDGQAALDAFADAGVQVTWCQVFPGGYGPEIYEAITAAGHEHALHYNAMHDADLASWGWPQIRAQYAWAQAVTGRERIVSNKNHYTRWEGWTEFYTWCERLGIEIDESRGPSKQGTVGFPFGTAHVSFPLAEAGAGRTFHDVLNLPLHTQDLAWAGHASIRDVILDGAQAQHGVAHFLFHGPHLNIRPMTRAACVELADEARSRGMQWWTAERINTWERTRRGVRLDVTATDEGWTLRVEAQTPVTGAAILLPAGVRVTGPDHTLTQAVRHGRTFTELAVDLPAGATTWSLTR
ncbi:hypothetical protein Bcav_3338 [Beutenbergia cavernae DSM 12333]|uniref:Polysaccharide deacetylase n=1 Tax=Beutenbergia cavernae (strain ATCC BAA-8 / DSM 12333 / CCUG 43141 / JCM 11478 / NBRC 16432 / NCIMB 13614 / HKI 0122) TaxID=471853 RepID=C5C1H1_BEUC1|nr:hypothetical protein Bcav_3338 [Beutenbergia cavernae DSM 12333]